MKMPLCFPLRPCRDPLLFLFFTAGLLQLAATDEDDEYLENFFNDTDQGPEYATDEVVTLCVKTSVNRFAASFIPAFYTMNFLLSLLGNSLVLCIIYKFEQLGTVTNIFLLNLVISDLIFASSLPFWAVYYSTEWIFGRSLCKLVGSLYSVGFYSSILFLTLMTFDRYLAVVHAITAAQSRRRTYAFASSGVVWFLSILASIKDMVLYDVRHSKDDGELCEETGYGHHTMVIWQLVGYYQQFSLFFLLPLLMVLYCYGRITVRIISTRMREKCRAVRLIFVIILTFFVCWTPYNVVILLSALRLSSGDKSCSDSLDYAMYVTRNIAYLYCCISPIFYTFVGKKFQNHFRKLLARHIPCLKITIQVSQSSRTTSFKSPNTESGLEHAGRPFASTRSLYERWRCKQIQRVTPSTGKRFSRGECVCCESVLHGGGDGIQGSQAAGGRLASAGARSRGGPCPALCGAVLVEGWRDTCTPPYHPVTTLPWVPVPDLL
ncbi:hypothetical protein NFI96_006671 [Prochilodus magdalenae]|nr:hypothetical protein NFI96_006671 [Prochilodus magdalenae]